MSSSKAYLTCASAQSWSEVLPSSKAYIYLTCDSAQFKFELMSSSKAYLTNDSAQSRYELMSSRRVYLTRDSAQSRFEVLPSSMAYLTGEILLSLDLRHFPAVRHISYLWFCPVWIWGTAQHNRRCERPRSDRWYESEKPNIPGFRLSV